MAASSVLVCLAFLNLLLTSFGALSLRVPASPLLLSYHRGPLLSGPEPIKLCITFYGDFESSERSTLKAFLSSLSPSSSAERRSLRSFLTLSIEDLSTPSVSKWWSLTQRYTDSQGGYISQRFEIRNERNDTYSLGKHLRASDMATLARRSVESSSALKSNLLVLVFTAADVYVEGFCMHACGGHSWASFDEFLSRPSRGGDGMVPFVWVGNPKMQCPGFCAWPFAKPQYGPPMEPLRAPNGMGIDGMIMTLAKILASTATNPFGDAYFQGDDATFGLEAGGVCLGQFGTGAYPGFPGRLLQDAHTDASYNMEGIDGRKFLVPWIWNPVTQACAGQA